MSAASDSRTAVTVLTVANQKGGVGKSSTLVQYAYYLVAFRAHRVLVIDLDGQGHASAPFREAIEVGLDGTSCPLISTTPASRVLTDPDATVENAPFVVVPADRHALMALIERAAEHDTYLANLARFVEALAGRFDTVLIDTGPSPDVRVTLALCVATHALSPVRMTRESIGGVSAFLHDRRTGVLSIRARINPALELLGILPTMLDLRYPSQRTWLTYLINEHPELMIRLADAEDGAPRVATIRSSAGAADAAAYGLPLWVYGQRNTSARIAWQRDYRPAFEAIAALTEKAS